MTTNNKIDPQMRLPAIVVTTIIIGMLLIAIPVWLPYGYYTFLRLIIMMSAFTYSAYLNTNGFNYFLACLFLITAVLFNPFWPIHLEKEAWVVIDFLVAILYGFGLYRVLNSGLNK